MYRIRGAGQVKIIANVADGPCMRIAKGLLQQIGEGFIKQSARYMKKVDDIPFVYREKQLHTLLVPVINDLTDSMFMTEFYVRRDKKVDRERIDRHGWVDYWCRYKMVDFYMELKHGFISARSEVVRQYEQEKWAEAISQIESARKSVTGHFIDSKGTVRIAFMVMPIYETVTNKEKPLYRNDIEKLIAIQNNVMQGLNPVANWSALWIPHETIDTTMEWSNATENYSGVLLMANVTEAG